jgi:hypothetical protein
MARTIGQYVERDSRGGSHVLWGQEWGSSCGPASCFMALCSATQSTQGGGEAFMRALAVRYGATIMDMLSPTGAGTYVSQLRQILEANRLRVNSGQYIQAEYISKITAASELKPIILHVNWFSRDNQMQWVRTGGHFVVSVGLIGSDAIVLDPWSGLVEIPVAAFPEYNPAQQSWSGPNYGQFSGWVVQVM